MMFYVYFSRRVYKEIFVQARAEPNLFGLCRAQPKISKKTSRRDRDVVLIIFIRLLVLFTRILVYLFTTNILQILFFLCLNHLDHFLQGSGSTGGAGEEFVFAVDGKAAEFAADAREFRTVL